MVWGTYLEKNCPSSNGHILVFGGSKRLPRWFGALTVFGSIQPCRMVKNGPKRSAPECPVECGGVQSLFGQCPNVGSNNHYGCSLRQFDAMRKQIGISFLWPSTYIIESTSKTLFFFHSHPLRPVRAQIKAAALPHHPKCWQFSFSVFV